MYYAGTFPNRGAILFPDSSYVLLPVCTRSRDVQKHRTGAMNSRAHFLPVSVSLGVVSVFDCSTSTTLRRPSLHLFSPLLLRLSLFLSLSLSPTVYGVPSLSLCTLEARPSLLRSRAALRLLSRRQNAISNQFKCKLKSSAAYKLFDSPSKNTASKDQTEDKT